jgi:Peptidase family M23
MVRFFVMAIMAAAVFGQAPQDLDGSWQGTIATPSGKLDVLFRVARAPDGIYLGTIGGAGLGTFPLDRIQISGESVRLESKGAQASFEGALNAAHTQIRGTWSEAFGNSQPLELSRVAAPAPPAAPAKLPAALVQAAGLPVDLEIPAAPEPFPGSDGKTHLVYELHITNPVAAELHLNRIEVLSGGETLASFDGAELNNLLQRPGVDLIDKRTIGGGLRAIAFLWVTLNAGAPVPAVLRHRLTIDEFTIEAAPIVVSAAKPIVLGPYLRGSDWMAGNGPDNASLHRRALEPVGGRLHLAQRYAIDWVKAGADGKTFSGDPKQNKSYHAYGSEILAVADATVAEAKDGIPENEPGSTAVPITLETVMGNHVTLDLGGGRYAFYAHMQPGSVRVKAGDRVRRGQVIGLVGNTGNSSEPHLHFHVADGISPLGSEGVPYVLDSFELLGGGATQPRRNALPMDRDRVRFAQ